MNHAQPKRPLHCGILFVGCAKELVAGMTEQLGLSPQEITHLADESIAADLATATRHAGLVVRYPLPGLDSESFLKTVRRPGSSSRDAAIVFLAAKEWRNAADALCTKGANRVVDLATAERDLPAVLNDLLTIATRFPIRAASRVEVPVGTIRRNILCQTVNVSSTGMLIRTGSLFPLGTELRFELSLPGTNEPLRGAGRVVRHTIEKRERLSGVGVTFSTFENDGDNLLLQHLAKQAG